MMTDQFNFDNPIIPGSIWDKNADYKIPVVSPVGNGPKGEKGDPAFFKDLTESELKEIYKQASFVGNKSEDAVITTTATETELTIPFVMDEFDMLFIDINGLDLAEHEDYELALSSGKVIFSTPIPAGQDVHFRALKYQLVDGDKTIKNYMGRKDYNTVAEMKADMNLESGDICHTLGFHTPGDGGAAWYIVHAHGVANDMDIIQLDNDCIAQLVITEDYVTPEMFGADSTATVDCSNILQYLINNYQNVACCKKYLLSTSIEINRNSFTFNGDGEFIYTGSAYAFGLSGYRNNIYFRYIKCTNANATAVRLATANGFGQNKVKISNIFSSYNGIEYISNDHSCTYNVFDLQTITASNRGINVDLVSTNQNWFNSNYIYNATFIGNSTWAIYLKCVLSDNSPVDIINGNNFINFSTENTDKGIYLNNARWNCFENFRGIDYQSSKKVISLNNESLYNTFKVVNFLWFGNIENNLTNPDACNIFEGQIGISDATPCWHKISVQKPVTYATDAVGVTPIEYSNAVSKGSGTWISGTSNTINPFQNRGYANKVLWISTDNVEVTLPAKYYNALAVNEVFFQSGTNNSKTFKAYLNDQASPYTFTTPCHIRFYTNATGSTYGAAEV